MDDLHSDDVFERRPPGTQLTRQDKMKSNEPICDDYFEKSISMNLLSSLSLIQKKTLIIQPFRNILVIAVCVQ
jgi:ribosome recycling factor